jgi:hypothetical protein
MRLYFGLTTAAVVFAGISGAPLSWDGGYYLFKILDTQASFVQYNRLSVVPLHSAVLLANRLTSDLTVLQAVFGLLYSAVPLLALAISWWIVRGESRPLFIWAALGIGVGTLPGQFYFTTEGIPALQLFWPILLAILTRVRGSQAPVVLLLATAVFFAHPVAAALFAFGAGLACLVGVRHQTDRRRMLLWALGLGVLAAARFSMIQPGYETDQLARENLSRHFAVSLLGSPLISLACAYLAAIMVFVLPLARAPHRGPAVFLIRALGLASLGLAGWLLVGWARDPHQWAGAVGFRSWALACSAPFMLLAAVEGLIRDTRFLPDLGGQLRYRGLLVNLAAGIFLAVLALQSRSWLILKNTLRDTMAQSSSACISQASVGWLDRTPLNHWATPAYAIILQGRAPPRLVLDGDGCAEARLSNTVRIAPWDVRGPRDGWFDFRPVLAQQESSRGCWFALGPAWYAGDQVGSDWWRWTEGTGKVRVFIQRDTEAAVRGELRSIRWPNNVDVLINGARQMSLEIRPDQFRAFEMLGRRLTTGENLIEFVNQSTEHEPPGDGRPPGVALKNLSLSTSDIVSGCELQP